ncbi:DUF4442 domain-containing protein [Aureibaculum sp. A20]|uniref:DUF4442 domain-containing protein n=1 Tax=Aureibaculum flavum TaxID=2795986 RepID=A0ABS0WTT1_9FLAO|nr:DUF4442 domain-containing protein [Aureibaculum flavum]MBJ2175389.1 DUF4442 domain-containing protein [Aureibaculum flavum]
MSKFTVKNLNKFLLFKLPSAYISGVRVKSIDDNEAIATVKHKWINQNPFKSLYWATQGMASELATGILVMKQIDESGKKISMLVTKQTGTFTKKATGRINFICKDGGLVKTAIDKTIATNEGVTLTMVAEGIDEQGDSVSKFEYEWSIKVKINK